METLGDAWEPNDLLPEALDWFDELGECPPLPEWLAVRFNARRKRTYLRWRDEAGELHAIWYPGLELST